jgi:nucleotide-binding universal stress UspA family protein
VARLRAEGVEAEAHVKPGHPATVILDLAHALAVELIAMTTHGRTGLGRLVFGSVAEEVLRRAPVPVFLVRVNDEQAATDQQAA